MAEIWKNAVEQTTPGYRQLAGAGSGRAPELKTVVGAGVAIVLGILAGTMLADGSLLGKKTLTANVSVQSPLNSSSTANRTSSAVAQLMPVQAQPAASQTAPASVAAQTSAKPAPQTQLASGARPASAAHGTSGREVTGAVKVSAAHRAVSGHKRRLAHWRRHLARHHAFGHHRLHVQQKATVADALPAAELPLKPIAKLSLKPVAPVTLSEFTVEGEDKIATYNASAGTIDTYEGESFAVDKATSASIGDEVASNVHYRCDQFWNCSLILDGQIVPNAKRTR
jgi:hypothetical protein